MHMGMERRMDGSQSNAQKVNHYNLSQTLRKYALLL